MDTLSIAVIGCGAVAERVHLPALARSPSNTVTVLVDSSEQRAKTLARQYGVATTAANYQNIVGLAEAAIIGVPHDLHATIACDLLDAGIHVLVEKPMALSPADARRMVDASR